MKISYSLVIAVCVTATNLSPAFAQDVDWYAGIGVMSDGDEVNFVPILGFEGERLSASLSDAGYTIWEDDTFSVDAVLNYGDGLEAGIGFERSFDVFDASLETVISAENSGISITPSISTGFEIDSFGVVFDLGADVIDDRYAADKFGTSIDGFAINPFASIEIIIPFSSRYGVIGSAEAKSHDNALDSNEPTMTFGLSFVTAF